MKKLLTCLLSSLLAVSYTVAQKATIVSMTETTDFIAGDDQRRDFNKELCALVKIQVVDEITDVEGNVIGDIVNHGVEKWVYMAKGSKNIKIHLKNNLPLRVMFRDYKVDALKSNRVYVLVLDVENKIISNQEVSAANNDLQMKIFPHHAIVKIWSDNMRQKAYRPHENGLLTVRLPYGRYYYLVTANGHHEKEGNVFINDEHHIETVSLSPITGTLTVSCPTEKVEFYVNGLYKGNDMKRKASSWTGELPPSSYVVEVFRKGYASSSKTVSVSANQATTLNFEPLLTDKAYKKNQKEDIAPLTIRKQVWQDYLIKLQKEAVNKVKNDAAKREQYIRDLAVSDVIQMMDGSCIPCTVVVSSSSTVIVSVDNHKGEFQIPKKDIDYIQYMDGNSEIINPQRK